MREILFKAKDLKGEWREGFYLCGDETTYCFTSDYERNPVKKHHYIARDVMTDWGMPNRFEFYEIDPATLCQFTGLLDSNGKKIFENDIYIIDWDEFSPVKVAWDEETAEFTGIDIYMNIDMPFEKEIIGRSEYAHIVVGNMFDDEWKKEAVEKKNFERIVVKSGESHETGNNAG